MRLAPFNKFSYTRNQQAADDVGAWLLVSATPMAAA
jgi:hypothetical protein